MNHRIPAWEHFTVEQRKSSIVTFEHYKKCCKEFNNMSATTPMLLHRAYDTHYMDSIRVSDTDEKIDPSTQIHPANVSWAFHLGREELLAEVTTHWVDYLIEIVEEYNAALEHCLMHCNIDNMSKNEDSFIYVSSIISYVFSMFKAQLGTKSINEIKKGEM